VGGSWLPVFILFPFRILVCCFWPGPGQNKTAKKALGNGIAGEKSKSYKRQITRVWLEFYSLLSNSISFYRLLYLLAVICLADQTPRAGEVHWEKAATNGYEFRVATQNNHFYFSIAHLPALHTFNISFEVLCSSDTVKYYFAHCTFSPVPS